jgi:hypothetical protein
MTRRVGRGSAGRDEDQATDEQGPAGRVVPLTRGEWALGRRPAPFVVDKPAPFRPELLVLLDVGADRLIAFEVEEPGKTPAAVARWAAEKLRPGIRLRVDDPAGGFRGGRERPSCEARVPP